MRYIIAVFFIVFSLNCFGQKTDSIPASDTAKQNVIATIESIPDKSLDYINKKYSKLSNTVQTQSEKLLNRMQQQEAKLQKKLQGVDSSKAKELFENSKAKYDALQQKIHSPINTATTKLKEYIPGLDSINTALKFLSQPDAIAGLTTDKLNQLSSLTGSVQELQSRLQQANEIQDFIRARETQLKNVLANTGLGKELLGINKEVFYYQQRLAEYKELINDKKKLEEKLISTVRTLPAFQKFWQKNSYLAQLFPMPGNYNATAQALPGLQTTASIQQQIQQRFGSQIAPATNNTMSGSGYFQQQAGVAQAQLNELKDKINASGGGSTDMTTPDFKPNEQKTKSFLQRFEYGVNFQSQQGTYFLPATTDIALNLGYKIADNKVAGISASYKLGWGSGWDHIAFSSEGLGLRSYLDIKAKGSFWLSAGFEYNYLSAFNSLQDLHSNVDVWQRCALAGLTKKYKMGKKREGKVQLLYDFLAAKQIPAAQGLKFRVGWNF
jgi:Skp family chaperone for outer membrane proteins